LDIKKLLQTFRFVHKGQIFLLLPKARRWSEKVFIPSWANFEAMKTRNLAEVVLLVVILQLALTGALYGLAGTHGVDISAIAAAFLLMVLVSTGIGVVLYWLVNRYTSERAVKVALMTLTEDERRVLEQIMQQGKVRQDDLRRQVDMSKSKLSALVNNLERKRAITKTRYHKTNILEPTEEFTC